MKKLLLTLSVIAGLLSNAFAIDLISVATNGKSNENSLGVKTLNNQEMSKIIGGAHVEGGPVYQYGIKNNSGAKISYTAYYRLEQDVNNELLPLNVDDGSGKYKPVVKATLNHSTNKVDISIIGMNQYNPVYTRPADSYYANQLINSNGKELFNSVNNKIRGDAGKYW